MLALVMVDYALDPNSIVLEFSVDSDVSLSVMVLQFGGEIPLPSPRSTAIRRHYSVEFGCDVQAASVSVPVMIEGATYGKRVQLIKIATFADLRFKTSSPGSLFDM